MDVPIGSVEMEAGHGAGEYLVGCHLKQNYKHVNVWIPSRDTGVDLLVSDRRDRIVADFLEDEVNAERQSEHLGHA